MKAALLTLGCKLNYAETDTYARELRLAGAEIVPWSAGADIFLINSCSVTAVADAKTRNLIRKVHRISPDARIAVTGCSAALRRRELESIGGVWRVFGPDEKASVVPELLGLRTAEHGGIFPAWSSGERTRSFLKVQDGCDNFCAYCTVPYARGHSRNVPVATLVAQAEQIASLGVKEIVLTGVNTGDFGRSTGESFLSLLQALEKVEGIERYRISSIEPNLLTDDIIGWIASGTKFQPHFHIPLQAGSDELLRAMGRRYDTALYTEKLEKVRRAMERPGEAKVFFGIDVMAGLPGETDALFEEGLAFIRSVRPAFIHVFPYSRRPGTPAASMKGQVSEPVKAERVKRLEGLCSELHTEFVEAHRGQKAQVLFESKEKNGMMGGYTGNYIRVSRPYEAALVGFISEVTL